jgi:hypothetical protein
LISFAGQGYYSNRSQYLSRSNRADADAGFVARFGFFLSSVISLHERLSYLFANPSNQGGDGMEPKGFSRKPTAIPRADITGPCRLMQDERGGYRPGPRNRQAGLLRSDQVAPGLCGSRSARLGSEVEGNPVAQK